MRGRTTFCLLAILLIAIAAQVTGQTAASPLLPRATSDLAPRPPETNLPHLTGVRLPPRFPLPPWSGPGFPPFARAAGMIFSGTVKRVERRPATRGQEVETVAITFHVETAIRGATPGEDVVISQWIGLWSSGQRYRVGERVLLILYPPSKLGLTSCVGGPLGRFGIDPVGRVLLTAQHLAAFQRDPVLGGKSRVRVSDFALAVRRAGGEE
jgi:hypothetical protein